METDDAEPQVFVAPVETEITISEGLWLSEAIPRIAEQLPNVTASQLWAALDKR